MNRQRLKIFLGDLSTFLSFYLKDSIPAHSTGNHDHHHEFDHRQHHHRHVSLVHKYPYFCNDGGRLFEKGRNYTSHFTKRLIVKCFYKIDEEERKMRELLWRLRIRTDTSYSFSLLVSSSTYFFKLCEKIGRIKKVSQFCSRICTWHYWERYAACYQIRYCLWVESIEKM